MSYKGKLKSKLHGVEEGYDLYAPLYEEGHAYLDTFENDVIFKMLGKIKGMKVLDMGCGAGRLTKFLKNEGAEVTAADLSEEMLKVVRKKVPGVETVKADIEELPFKDDNFDIVTSAFVIVHLEYLDKAFEEIYRVLKPGGFFVVTNVNQRKPPKLKTKDGEKFVIKSEYHRPEDVREALKSCFFEIEEEKFVFGENVWINQIIKARK